MKTTYKTEYKIAGTAEMKALDAYAIDCMGIPSLDLMEQAALSTTDALCHALANRAVDGWSRWKECGEPGKVADGAPCGTAGDGNSADGARETAPGRVAVFCGSGNNGGDGVAVARQLLQRGYAVRCFMVGNPDKMTADCAANAKRLEEAGGRLELWGEPGAESVRDWVLACDGIVDALFGFSLNRDVAGRFADVVGLMNEAGRQGACLVSCDLPSGIQGDSGQVLGVAVKADITVTFSCMKPGLLVEPGKSYAGRVLVADIGIPENIITETLAE